MQEVKVRVHGAIVINREEERIRLLAVGMHAHAVEIFFHEPDSGARLLMAVGPVQIAGVVDPPADDELDNIIHTDWVNLGTPLYRSARPIVTLPRGQIVGGRTYPGTWLVGKKPSVKICCEAEIILHTEALTCKYNPHSMPIDLDRGITVRNLPAGVAHDCDDVDEFDHFQQYALISHGVPGNVAKPTRLDQRGSTTTIGSVCPPVVH